MATACTRPDPSTDLSAIQLAAAGAIADRMIAGESIDGFAATAIMQAAAGSSIAAGGWDMRQLYDACEAAQVIAVRRTPALLAGSTIAGAEVARQLMAAAPSQTRRNELQIDFQQFSTPLAVAWAAAQAAALSPSDIVLEPSAGTGLLAVFAELAGAKLLLNELEPGRRALLQALFPKTRVTAHDGAQIHAHLAQARVQPTVAILNPPYARSGGRRDDRHAAARHIRAALQALAPDGRCVAVMPMQLSRRGCLARDFAWLAELATPLLNIILPERSYQRHGTGVVVRLAVFDKLPRNEPRPAEVDIMTTSLAAALKRIAALPPRCDLQAALVDEARHIPSPAIHRLPVATTAPVRRSPVAVRPLGFVERPVAGDIVPVRYTIRDDAAAAQPGEELYQSYRIRRIALADARPHPTELVESVAMAAVLPPVPRYVPQLPAQLLASDALSDAQLETLIYAGEAHGVDLPGSYKLDPESKLPVASHDCAEGSFVYRRGFFLGDGTGCGKGRQVAGILLDNWLRGRRRAVWLSASDKLLEDARRDWQAVGGLAGDIVPQGRFKLGEAIPLSQGILFTTYATFRTPARGAKASRLDQIIAWCGGDAGAFDGCVIFDEAHAMANALPAKAEPGSHGDTKGTAQGLAGLALQNRLPHARIVYVSATGATQVRNLGYANRLGLWGHGQAPFASREQLVSAMEAGGVAAMELVARDLKTQGLYIARALSFAGVEYEIAEHKLTPEQIVTYDAYCAAFEIIHNNLEAAFEAIGIVDPLDGRSDSQARAAALSAFESMKQRFFNALLTGMKCPTLIRLMREDLGAGHASIVQLVSTAEAMLNRRLAELSDEDRAWLDIDMTPREGVMTYLSHSFPVTLMQEIAAEDDAMRCVPVTDDDGNAVICPEAAAMRDAMLEHLGALPAVPAALDQIIAAFGAHAVAEITGRSKRLVLDASGRQRLETRPASANLAEARAFMDDDKRVLCFSQAGGTGRSYHADLGVRNQRRRIHNLLEAGWRADVAIQGLGRSHRTNQASAPLFRPITTDVKAEKRFTSTIARRLDSLGALTRGQRQTGGQGLFRAEDNLESSYAMEALRHWYARLAKGYIAAIGIDAFEARTGLKLRDKDGSLKEELPPIQRWLNRLLALPIALQNAIFDEYEDMIAGRVLAAREAGSYDEGVETIRADRIEIVAREVIRTDEATRAETVLVTLRCGYRQRFNDLARLLKFAGDDAVLLINRQSKGAAIRFRAPAVYQDGGGIERRWCLERPRGHDYLLQSKLDESNWRPASRPAFDAAWAAEVAKHSDDCQTDELTMMTGLILPVWKHLDQKNLTVKRAEIAGHHTLLGPVLQPATVAKLRQGLGLKLGPIAPDAAWSLVMGKGATIDCAHGVALKASRSFGQPRFEVANFPAADLAMLKALGCASDIVSFKTRLYVADNDRSDAVLRALLERYPPV